MILLWSFSVSFCCNVVQYHFFIFVFTRFWVGFLLWPQWQIGPWIPNLEFLNWLWVGLSVCQFLRLGVSVPPPDSSALGFSSSAQRILPYCSATCVHNVFNKLWTRLLWLVLWWFQSALLGLCCSESYSCSCVYMGSFVFDHQSKLSSRLWLMCIAIVYNIFILPATPARMQAPSIPSINSVRDPCANASTQQWDPKTVFKHFANARPQNDKKLYIKL